MYKMATNEQNFEFSDHSEEDLLLNMSATSSVFDDDDEVYEYMRDGKGISLYQFEPYESTNSSDTSSILSDPESQDSGENFQLQNTEW